MDISEQRIAQETLQRWNAILEAVGYAAEQFLKSADWEDCILKVLEHLGRAARASRVYVFKKHLSLENRVLISQLFEWCNEGIGSQINNSALQNMDFSAEGYDRWIKLFDDGLPAVGIIKDLPPGEQLEFMREGILSIICFPIQIDNEWWGFIGLADCLMEREWPAVEIEALRVAVSTLGAAIRRKLSDEAISESEISYQGLFNSVNDAIYIQDANGRFLDVNEGAVQMYGYPKEFFIGKTQERLSAPNKNDLNEVKEAIQRAFEGEPQQIEFWGLRSNGEIFPKDVRLFKGSYFGQDVIIAIAQDITERKHADDALQRQLKELTILHSVALAEASARNIDELIQRVTDIIGNTLYSDNCGVLLVNTAGDALQPHFSYRGTTAENIAGSYPLTKGISGRVASSRKPIRTGNVALEPFYLEVTSGILSELCVPIVSGETTFGVLNVESKKSDAFIDADERLLNTIAGGLATALERLKLFEQEQRRTREAEILREATSALTTSLELPRLLETILDSLSKLIPYDSASINLEEGGTLVVAAGRGLPEDAGLIGKRYQSALKWEELTADRKPIVLTDAQADPTFEKWKGTEYIRGWICIPLIAHDKFIGLLNLDSKKVGAFKQEDANLLQTFANPAAIAIENARLFESQLQRRQEAEILREATAALTTSIEPQRVYEIILDSLSKLVRYTSASIELLDGDFVEIVAQHGLPQNQSFIGIRYAFQRGKWGLNLWQPIIIPDVQVDDRFEKFPGTEYIHGWMGVPLIAQDKLIGYLNLDNEIIGYYTDEHASLVQTFANQAAIALENARIFQEEKRRSKIIEALADIANEITTMGEVGSLLDKVAYRTHDLLSASHVAIYLLQDDSQTIMPVTAQGSFSKEILSHLFKLGEGITGSIMASGKSEIINDTTNDPRRIRVPGTPEEDGILETMMSSPLILNGKAIGAINVWRLRSEGLFNESELNFLISIAHQTSISIESGRLFQETVQRAQESAALAEVGRDISTTLQLDIVLERIAVYAKELLRAETSAVYISDPTNLALRAIAAIGKDHDEIKNDPLQVGAGILGNIAKSKVGEIVNETTKDSRTIIVKGTEVDPYEHIMGVPVLSKDKLTGLLVVWRSGINQEFKQNDLDFLTSLALQAAVAIENARLFQLEQKRRQEAENLRIAAAALTSSLEPQNVLETILVVLQEVISYDSATIMQLEDEHVRITAEKGLPRPDLAINQIFPASNELLLEIKRNGQPLIVKDCQKDSRFEKWAAGDNIRGWMGIPLIARGQVIGYITMDSFTPDAFDDNDASLAQTFGHQAAAAIENARLYTETKQRLEELEVVSRISFALRAARDSGEMLPILLEEIKLSMDTDTVSIWLYSSGKDELIQKAGSGELGHLPRSNFKSNEGIVGRVFLTGKIHVSTEFSKDPITLPENGDVFGKDLGGITVPIRTTSETIGVLLIAIPAPRHIEQHHIRLITTIAEIAGNAINRSDLYERSEEQVKRLITLREMDTAIASSFDLQVTFDILAKHLLTKMGADATAILTFNPESQTLNYFSATGFRDQEILSKTLRMGEGLAGALLDNHKDIYIINLHQKIDFMYSNLILKEGFTSYYAILLESKGVTRGVLEVYFRTPFTPPKDWIDFLHALAGQVTIAIDNTRLFENLQRSNQELSLAYDTTLEGWGKALEMRDKETEGHTRRVADLTLKLARQLGIPESDMTHIRRGALLHDIGKMGVPDRILRKEGPLTKEEWVEMRKHPQYAHDLLFPIPYLRSALDIPYSHHEWWDGSGYPSGLKGEEIPLSARIFAVVDVWDALLSNRPYRSSWSKPKVIKYLRGRSGKQFDPKIVEVFLRMMGIDAPKSVDKIADKKVILVKPYGKNETGTKARLKSNSKHAKNKKLR